MRVFGVLGPTEVRDAGQRLGIGGLLPRRLVAALVAAEGRSVSDDQLAESVWAGQPPASPPAALQVYASRLRRALGDTRQDTLQRTAAGYRLITAPGTTDIEQFTGQVSAARLLSASGQDGAALPVLDAALRLWRGDPFADLPAELGVSAARAQLAELRAAAEEDRAAALLASGQEAEAVASLEALAGAAPYREKRWALLVLSLYRCGRQAEALAAVRRVRALLADQLGVDPGPELQRLEQQVLRQDPQLLPAGHRAATRGPAAPARHPVTQARNQAGHDAIGRPLSPLFGREADLALLAGLVAAHQLVTVVGTAGVGKTRLTIEHAAARRDADGPWLVRLADVTDPAALGLALAAAFPVAEASAATPQTLAAALRQHRGLLLLDNCEHLASHVAAFVLAIIGMAPGLHVLATSRVPLGIEGERQLPLRPLPADQAVALLTDRIRAVRPTWQPGDTDRDAMAHVAAALDGIPLALELAAARAPVLGLDELATHLDSRITVLGRVPAGSLTPHTTLEAAIGWSVDLLPDADRAVLLRLWPYEGGFGLGAVAAAAGFPSPAAAASVESARHPESAAPAESAVDILASLVSRSLVVADTAAPPSRYRLLEIMRKYCRARDPAPGRSQAAHAAFVHRLAAQAETDLQGRHSARAVRMLTQELPNIRAAISYDLAADPAAALQAAGQLRWLWVRSGLVLEGFRLLQRCLDAAPDAPASDIARARTASAALEYVAGNGDSARAAIAAVARALAAATSRTDRALHAESLYYHALLQVPDGDPQTALTAAAEAQRISGELGLDWLAALAQMTAGAALLMLGRTGDGRQALHAAARDALACGVEWTAAASELMLAQSMLTSGDPALPVLRRALARFRREEDVSNVLVVLHNGPQALAAAGHPTRARQLRAAVDQHIARRGMRLGQTYAAGSTPGAADGGPQGEPATAAGEPPSLAETIALFDSDP